MDAKSSRRRFLQLTGGVALMPLPALASQRPTYQAPPPGLRARARDLGISLGDLPTGPVNAITDVEGVHVGHTTIIKGEGPLVEGKGPARTGVTAILAHGNNLAREAVAAAAYTHNGNGEMTGYLRMREAGVIAAPILLTGTYNVGRVYDFALEYMLGKDPTLGDRFPCPVPVVAETSDATLNDMVGRLITAQDVAAAIDGARGGPVAEGAVGGGTGMVAYGFKGGIGHSVQTTLTAAGRVDRRRPRAGQSRRQRAVANRRRAGRTGDHRSTSRR